MIRRRKSLCITAETEPRASASGLFRHADELTATHH